MSLLTRFKQFISPTGEVAQNELPAPIGDVWTRHNFTPIVNWAGAYQMWKANPVAQACSLTYSLMMPEAQLGVITPTGYNYDEPIVGMLTRNQWRVTMGEIMTILCIGGNAYGYKLRNASGAVIGVRWYSDKSFAPVNDGYGDVSHYMYYDGQVAYEVRKEDVIHIVGFWYDPEKPLGGGSPVELAAQSIEGYNEASATVFNIHKNDAMPKTIVVYDEELTPEQVSLAERSFKRKYGGDRRGSVGIMWGVKDVKRLALDWNELGLADTFGQYETRICGAYKVHPIIAGTHMGLSQSTYSNFEQASKDFTNMVRVPFWNMLADQLNAQLAIPEYGVELGFDLSTVQALAGDHIANEAVSTSGTTDTNQTSDGGAVPAKALDFRYKIGSGEEAVIVDIDDTLITSSGNPKQNVIDYVNAKHETYKIHIVTGRMIDDRERTLRDLERIGVKYDELHLNDTTAPTITWKEYKAGKIQKEQPVDLAIDNDRDTRAMYRSLGIDTLNPSDIPETAGVKSWLQHPDGYVYSKQYDDVLKPYDERIAKSWAKTAMKLAEYMRDTKNRSAIETKADDFSIDLWTQEFLDATEKDRSDLIDLVVRLSQEEVDAEPGEFAKAREAGQVESSNKIVETVPTLRADVQSVILANPRASADELSNLIYDKISNITKARANAIGRTTATATTGTVQKSVWDEIGGIKRTWVALAGARPAHAGAHDTPEDADGMFTVGGERTPYPAGPGLSAANSVNCRCFARARRDV